MVGARPYPLKITKTTARTAKKTTTASQNSRVMVGTFATWFDVAYEHALSFGLGLFFGFVAANRYRLTKRNGDDEK